MGLYAQLMARFYDRFMRGAEEAGLSDMRHSLLAGATGDVIEIGAGTGLNFTHYPPAAERLVLSEPEEPMAGRLQRRVGASGRAAEVVLAPAESLPFPDDSFDTAVSTLALCTVRDPLRSLAEVRRVLKPGGTLLFLEHVRADDPAIARRQDRVDPLWRRFAGGCRCNRTTEAFIRAAGFDVLELDHGRMPEAPSFVRPMIAGRAIAAPAT